MRAFVLSLVLALAGVGGATAVAADTCEKCGHPGCQCTDCGPGCRCCGPASQGSSGQLAKRFSPSKTPVTAEGVRVTADLPVEQHHRNTGGMGRRGPGTGAGLCVFTSAWHAAIWQNLPELYGYRDWMKNKPGGGWPEKVDATLKQYCSEKGVAVPGYVQHTGGDVDFLKAALKTGRMVCVTYAGRDDFYSGPIAHMVNLVYLDDKVAVILDNNRPGTFLRMSSQDFVERWMAMSGGWAFAFTAPPPPPYATKPAAQEFLEAPEEKFQPGPGGAEWEGEPQDLKDSEVGTYDEVAPKAKAAGLPMVTFVGRPAKAVHGCYVARVAQLDGFIAGDVVVSRWVNGKHVGVKTHLGTRTDVANWVAEVDTALAQLRPENEQTLRNFGVDWSKIARERRYSFKGQPVSKEEAERKFKLPDDADLKSLTFVGSPAYIKQARAAVAGLPESLRTKFLTQFYPDDDWAVSQFSLRAGVTVRDADAPVIDRVGKELGHKEVGDLTTEVLVMLINAILNPPPPLPEPAPTPRPAPDPKPAPAPVDPRPAPVPPQPQPTPQPEPAPLTLRDAVQFALAALALYLLYKSRNQKV